LGNYVISVQNVSKTFKLDQRRGVSKIFKRDSKLLHGKTFKALDDISFTVEKGEILGIIGLNGSGKSTLLRIIAGVYKPDTGHIEVKERLSPLLQLGSGFHADLDARENIIMNGMLLGISKSEITQKVDTIIEYSELEKFSRMKLKNYSSGMKARLAFATAMQLDPEILLVDEIMAVGDKNFRKKSYETFLSFKKNKKTILHATHSLEKLSEFSDRVLLLHKGKQIMIGKPDEVLKTYLDIKSK